MVRLSVLVVNYQISQTSIWIGVSINDCFWISTEKSSDYWFTNLDPNLDSNIQFAD